jgi:hypothetical protein
MGPHQPRSRLSGPNLPEAPADLQVGPKTISTTLQPWKTLDDLIQIPEDLPGLWRKSLP